MEHLCPMAFHVRLPGDRTVPPCSAHLRRPSTCLKESVCCWGVAGDTAGLSVQWPCQGKVLPFCWQLRHGDSEAVVAEASLPILRPHLKTPRGLTATLQGSSYTPRLCPDSTFTLPRSAKYKVAGCSQLFVCGGVGRAADPDRLWLFSTHCAQRAPNKH